MFEYIFKLFHMGGYGIYVWPCYALLLGLLTWQIYAAIKRNLAMHLKIKQDQSAGSNSDQQT